MKTINIDEFINTMPFACHGYRSKIKIEMVDFAEQVLKLAAENTVSMVQNSEEEVYIGVVFEINDSIINTINQIV
jgi:hypothetical protein